MEKGVESEGAIRKEVRGGKSTICEIENGKISIRL